MEDTFLYRNCIIITHNNYYKNFKSIVMSHFYINKRANNQLLKEKITVFARA
jgi:hypothetical protein